MKAAPFLALVLAAAPVLAEDFTPPQAKNARPLRDVTYVRSKERLGRGRLLTEGVLECFLCHSDRDWSMPGAPPVKRVKGAGHVFWEEKDGTRLVAPNITPDKETGAGRWTDDMLARAIREGVGHDGRPLHPQMWYTSFRNLSDEDVASIIVALRALRPVRRQLPQTRLTPQRYEAIQRDPAMQPLEEKIYGPDPKDALEYGKYLVRAADCQGCHTAFEAPLNPGLFGGGNHIELYERVPGRKREVFSRNITPDPSGIPYYDGALFLEAMRTGKVRARELDPIMPFIAFGRVPDRELLAMFAFLKTLPKVAHVVDKAEPMAPCAMCGQTHGGGKYNKPKNAGAIPIDAATAASLTGTYRFEDGFTFEIKTEKGRLLAGLPGQKGSELFTKDGKLFLVMSDIAALEFVRDAAGRVTGCVDHGYYGLKGTKLK